MASVMEPANNAFLARHEEKANLNQYWYSQPTIAALVQEVEASCQGGGVAFLSTPSIYFSLPKESAVRAASWVFDYDDQWAKNKCFFKYDYREPEALPAHVLHSFAMVVIDPPFITRAVWEQYATTARLLLAEGGRVIASTVAENEVIMKELFGATPCRFKPSIPHLVYQYNLFTNFEPVHLSSPNPEVPEDD